LAQSAMLAARRCGYIAGSLGAVQQWVIDNSSENLQHCQCCFQASAVQCMLRHTRGRRDALEGADNTSGTT